MSTIWGFSAACYSAAWRLRSADFDGLGIRCAAAVNPIWVLFRMYLFMYISEKYFFAKKSQIYIITLIASLVVTSSCSCHTLFTASLNLSSHFVACKYTDVKLSLSLFQYSAPSHGGLTHSSQTRHVSGRINGEN